MRSSAAKQWTARTHSNDEEISVISFNTFVTRWFPHSDILDYWVVLVGNSNPRNQKVDIARRFPPVG